MKHSLLMTRTLALILVLTSPGAIAQAPAFDESDNIPTSTVLPSNWQSSLHHKVEPRARVEGDHLVFELDSALGKETIHSLALLGIRIHEVTTMASAAAQFEREERDIRDALVGRRGVGSESVLDLLTQPLQTASALANNLGSNLESTLEGEYLERGAEDLDPKINEDPRIAPFKRSVAAQLNLDTYSSNPAVQGFLNHLASLRAAGKLRQVMATVDISGINSPLQARDVSTAKFEALIKNNEADKLAEMQSSALRAMDIDIALVYRFVTHPAYSPRHRTFITGYLEQLKGVKNRAAVLHSAVSADDEADALAHQKIVRTMAALHKSGTTLTAFESDTLVPTARARGGQRVYFIPVDYVAWNRDSAATVHALVEASEDDVPFIVIAGRFSDATRQALQEQGVAYREGFRPQASASRP